MPLGDSITEITCWRAYLWDQLAEAGLTGQVAFVGSMRNNRRGCRTKAPNFDTTHEGHSGWLSINIANDYLEGWLAAADPDIVQFMLGTNDINQGRTTDAIIESYTEMVLLMRASNSRMRIIVSVAPLDISSALIAAQQVDKVTPLSTSRNPAVIALNDQIPDWAANMTTSESPIQIADCSADAGFTRGMLRDGVHPNDKGDQFIAAQVGPLVLQAVEDVIFERSQEVRLDLK